MKKLSEMILACLYYFIGGGCEHIGFILGEQGIM